MSPSPIVTAPLSLEYMTDFLMRCQWPLYTFLVGIVGEREQARDLMQDTFSDAWRTAQRGLPPFSSRGESEAERRRWLFHVAYHRACSTLRRRRLISWLPLDHAAPLIGENGSWENQIVESHAVRTALGALAPVDRSCLLLIVVHGFTAAEVSEIIGGSPQAVAKRFSRAKQRLRNIYLAQNPEETRQ